MGNNQQRFSGASQSLTFINNEISSHNTNSIDFATTEPNNNVYPQINNSLEQGGQQEAALNHQHNEEAKYTTASSTGGGSRIPTENEIPPESTVKKHLGLENLRSNKVVSIYGAYNNKTNKSQIMPKTNIEYSLVTNKGRITSTNNRILMPDKANRLTSAVYHKKSLITQRFDINLLTCYCPKQFTTFKVRTNQVMTITDLKERVALHLKTTSNNVIITVKGKEYKGEQQQQQQYMVN